VAGVLLGAGGSTHCVEGQLNAFRGFFGGVIGSTLDGGDGGDLTRGSSPLYKDACGGTRALGSSDQCEGVMTSG
jgi:hypothetical protein